MKRFIIIILCIALCLSIFTACKAGNINDDKSIPNTESSNYQPIESGTLIDTIADEIKDVFS